MLVKINSQLFGQDSEARRYRQNMLSLIGATLTDACQAGWSKKAQKNGWIPDRSGETIAIVLDQLTEPRYQLLTPEPDGKSYRVTLR